jgi:hypothetical protein
VSYDEKDAAMKKLSTVAMLVVVSWLLAACSGGQPKMAIETAKHNFGQVRQGQVVTADIPVRNVGQGALTIEAVSTSCGCTSATVEPSTIAPGTQGMLRIRYDSGAHPDAGPVQRMIFIASNDPHTPEHTVLVNADVQVVAP